MLPRLVRPTDLQAFRFSDRDHCRLALLSAPGDGRAGAEAAAGEAVAANRAGAPTVFLEVHDPSDRVPFHSHHEAAELFFVLRGAALFHVGERTIRARGGDFVVVPPDLPHDLQNPGPGRLYLITVLSRDAGFADLLQHGIPTPLDAEDLAVLRNL
jgi:mannose-6-phosphate isomerase-like protein (cupin superfamily)